MQLEFVYDLSMIKYLSKTCIEEKKSYDHFYSLINLAISVN